MPSSPSAKPDPTGGPADWIRGRVFAHRGLHGPGAIENSLPAFEAAIEAGLGIECDIQRSRDGQPIVFHDWNLKRLIGEDVATQDLDAQELCRKRFTERDDGPTHLDKLLELVGGRVPLLIEVKSRKGYDIAPSCTGVARSLAGYDGRAAVMSFDPRVPRWFAIHRPDRVRGLVVTEEGRRGLTGHWQRWTALRHSRAQFLAYDIRDLPSDFARRHRAGGMPVASWTVRNAEHRRRAALYADAPIAEGSGL